MSAEPLTKEEKSWLKKLEKVMKSCPSDRLECYTIGDNDIMFYDKNVFNQYVIDKYGAYNEANDVGRDVDDSGAYLKRVYANFGIISAAG